MKGRVTYLSVNHSGRKIGICPRGNLRNCYGMKASVTTQASVLTNPSQTAQQSIGNKASKNRQAYSIRYKAPNSSAAKTSVKIQKNRQALIQSFGGQN